MSKKTMFAALLAVAIAFPAHAVLVVDQEMTEITLPAVPISGRSRLAQTVTAGMTGRLTRVQVPIACQPTAGNVTIEIAELDGDVPGTTILATAMRPPAELPPAAEPVFYEFNLSRPVHMSAGDRFALIVDVEHGPCTQAFGNDYARGHAYFDTFTLGWLRLESPFDPDDLAFRTLIEEQTETACSVNGFDLWFGRSTPVCRCLADASLRELRCGLFHPEMFLFRRVPMPIRAGEPFTVKWTLVALKPLKDIVELRDVLPPNFDGSKGPLAFFADKLQAGESITLEYKAMAPKPGKFKIDTHVEDGRMQTMIEVDPK